MPQPDPQSPRRQGPGRLKAAALAVALAAGAWLIHDGSTSSGPPQPPASASDAHEASPVTAASPKTADRQPGPAPLPPAAPTRIRIPSIKVDAPMVGLDLDAQRHLATPPMENRNVVGWYRNGASPGAVGNAILVGHVDNHSGPTVFYRLSLVHKGDRIEVLRGDRRTAVFTVDAVRTYAKSAFPNDIVYGATARPELRLITCGGHFDRRTGYQSNVVVFSHLIATH